MWFKRKSTANSISKPAPTPAPTLNERESHQGRFDPNIRIASSDGQGSISERFNLLDVAAKAIEAHGHKLAQQADCLVHESSGLLMQPTLEEWRPVQRGGVQTVSIMRTVHPRVFPKGVFEYQHSSGSSVEDSLKNGFDQWAQVDLVVLLDAVLDKPVNCMSMEIKFEPKEGIPARTRRAVFSPVAHMRQHEPAIAEGEDSTEEQKHPFCPCCMLTQSFDAFKPLIDGDAFYAIRMFAMRDENGEPEADCRVNGEDWAEGKEALRKYVRTWPEAGFEFRKQYVVLQTVGKENSAL